MFPLLRYFSLTSLGALAVALGVVLWFAQDASRQHLFRLGQENNIALTRAFTNSVWPNYSTFLFDIFDEDGTTIREHPTTPELDEAIRALTAGLTVLKVKIYSPAGNTVFSTEPAQIGDRRPTHPAIVAARNGGVTSEMIERGRFSAMDGERGHVHLIASYVPIQDQAAKVVGVMEVYNDITALVAQANREAWNLATRLGTAFAVLYLALFLVVRHGDRLLRRQYAEISAGHEQARAQALRLEKEIADRQRVEREVLVLREVQVNQRALRTLVANLSHELRTPLNAIIGFAQIIAGKSLGPGEVDRYAGYARDIESSGQHLLSIINTMLDLAKAEAGKMDLTETVFDPARTVADCIHMLQQQAAAAGVDLVHRRRSAPADLCADERMVRQIVLNLLSNAVKFTPAGGRVEIDTGLDADGTYCLTVSDTGAGIAEDMIPRVMSPFGQVDDALSRRHQGTGLGLPIVKSLVDLHGGAFGLESEVGRGTSVSVRFPARRTRLRAA
ncbi:MAG: HAMP domain-containing histidine kinase [Rhodospirillales bacterium]|nr:HAMP domain-containing histidine kinase [Rhodospirillales bacterium]